MTDLIKPQSVTSASDLPPRGTEVKKASESMPAGDFRHLLQSQVCRAATHRLDQLKRDSRYAAIGIA